MKKLSPTKLLPQTLWTTMGLLYQINSFLCNLCANFNFNFTVNPICYCFNPELMRQVRAGKCHIIWGHCSFLRSYKMKEYFCHNSTIHPILQSHNMLELEGLQYIIKSRFTGKETEVQGGKVIHSSFCSHCSLSIAFSFTRPRCNL